MKKISYVMIIILILFCTSKVSAAKNVCIYEGGIQTIVTIENSNIDVQTGIKTDMQLPEPKNIINKLEISYFETECPQTICYSFSDMPTNQFGADYTFSNDIGFMGQCDNRLELLQTSPDESTSDSEIEPNSGFWGNLPVVKCGTIEIPAPIPPIVRTIVNLIKIAAPLVLIIIGMADMLFAVIANDEKKIKEAQLKFPKRLLPAALIFLIVTICQFLVGIIADSEAEAQSLTDCIDCMISDSSKCLEVAD